MSNALNSFILEHMKPFLYFYWMWKEGFIMIQFKSHSWFYLEVGFWNMRLYFIRKSKSRYFNPILFPQIICWLNFYYYLTQTFKIFCVNTRMHICDTRRLLHRSLFWLHMCRNKGSSPMFAFANFSLTHSLTTTIQSPILLSFPSAT